MNDVKDFTTVRITFEKKGRARYISHLDLNRTMIRALRRAELPIWYTEGFNKHPYVTFAAPLSLGFEGARETMDVRLNEEYDMDELVHRLDAVMPEGLHVTAAAFAVKKAGDVDRAVYEVTLGCSRADVEAFLSQPAIVVKKKTKKKVWKELDLAPVLQNAQSDICDREEGVSWQLTLPCNSTDSVNPSLVTEALRAFLGQDELPCAVRRLAVLDKDGNPFA